MCNLLSSSWEKSLFQCIYIHSERAVVLKVVSLQEHQHLPGTWQKYKFLDFTPKATKSTTWGRAQWCVFIHVHAEVWHLTTHREWENGCGKMLLTFLERFLLQGVCLPERHREHMHLVLSFKPPGPGLEPQSTMWEVQQCNHYVICWSLW